MWRNSHSQLQTRQVCIEFQPRTRIFRVQRCFGAHLMMGFERKIVETKKKVGSGVHGIIGDDDDDDDGGGGSKEKEGKKITGLGTPIDGAIKFPFKNTLAFSEL